MAAPRIFDIAADADAAYWGLQPWERDYLLDRCFSGRRGDGVQGRAEFIINHIQDGTTVGSLDWWVNGPEVQASSNYLVNKDGTIVRCIPERDGPWTNGDVQNPTPQSLTLRQRGGNLNLWCVTIEWEGRPWHALTEAQMAAGLWLNRDIAARHSIRLDRTHVLPHYAINSVSRYDCPRPHYEAIMIALESGQTGNPSPVPATGQFGSVVRYPKPVATTVTALEGLNLRRWGETTSELIRTVDQGKTLWLDGYVIGEPVADNNRWHILSGPAQLRAWSGATALIPGPKG